MFSQTEEMNYAMDGLNKYTTEDDINALALKHFDDQTLLQVIEILYLSIREYYYCFIIIIMDEHLHYSWNSLSCNPEHNITVIEMFLE